MWQFSAKNPLTSFTAEKSVNISSRKSCRYRKKYHLAVGTLHCLDLPRCLLCKLNNKVQFCLSWNLIILHYVTLHWYIASSKISIKDIFQSTIAKRNCQIVDKTVNSIKCCPYNRTLLFTRPVTLIQGQKIT